MQPTVLTRDSSNLAIAGLRAVPRIPLHRDCVALPSPLKGGQVFNPDEAKRRYDTAVAERRVVIDPTDAGTANLFAFDLPANEAAAIASRLHAVTKNLHGTSGESRTMDQLRTDVLLDYLNGIGRDTSTSRGNVDVTVMMKTLTGLADHPGDLAGFGPRHSRCRPKDRQRYQQHTPRDHL